MGIVDSVVIDHMRPSGISGLYKRVGGIEKAREEQEVFRRRFGIADAMFALQEPGHGGAGEVLTVANTPQQQR